ncbi:hypothetical protein BJV82DRAFT_666652 [Fennellomyces sp. T-0311]|nr:hypothetical protein BJV82DRAFT_666652 [Fennellomyces sp. T-0311]
MQKLIAKCTEKSPIVKHWSPLFELWFGFDEKYFLQWRDSLSQDTNTVPQYMRLDLGIPVTDAARSIIEYGTGEFANPQSKYADDIRPRGVTSSYSTTSFEQQHIIDVKKPAKRTNRRFDSLSQMANFVYKKDLLFDTTVNQSNEFATAIRAEKSTRKVTTKRYDLSYTMTSSITPQMVPALKTKATLHGCDKVIRSFLDVAIEKRFTSVAARNTPQLDNDNIKVYQTLTIMDNDTNGIIINEKIRMHDQFHGRERKDFAVFQSRNLRDPSDKYIYESYGQVLLLFQATYEGKVYDLVLARRYKSLNEVHKTGLEVLSPCLEENYKGLFVTHVNQVKRSIHVVPNFSTKTHPNPVLGSKNTYKKYLLNHDSDRFSWSNSDGKLPKLKESSTDFVHWEIVGTNHGDDEEETSQGEDDDSDICADDY